MGMGSYIEWGATLDQCVDCVVGSPQASTGSTPTRAVLGTPSKCSVTLPPEGKPASTPIRSPME